jgi:vacuolar protein sorting-associated protein 54
MSDRARVHVNNLIKMDWERDWIDQGGDPEKYYMDTLCRETTVLHKVLSKHLPNETLLSIMEPVFQDYKWRLREGWAEVVVRSEAGKQRYELPLLICVVNTNFP